MGYRSMGQKHSRRQQRAYSSALSASRGASGQPTSRSNDSKIGASTSHDGTFNVAPKIKLSGDEKDPPLGHARSVRLEKRRVCTALSCIARAQHACPQSTCQNMYMEPHPFSGAAECAMLNRTTPTTHSPHACRYMSFLAFD